MKCVHRIWMDLGVQASRALKGARVRKPPGFPLQVVMCLSEVTMYASELLEDEVGSGFSRPEPEAYVLCRTHGWRWLCGP